MGLIDSIQARAVFDSRGYPTVEVEVGCSGGARGRAIVPSGASTGKHEALELRDRDPTRYSGMGVSKAIRHVEQVIAPELVGQTVQDQSGIDRRMFELDGTPSKSRLGANAILGVSLACAHAAAAAERLELFEYLALLWQPLLNDIGAPDQDSSFRLPMPMVNMISGGRHAGGNLDFQDFLIIPLGAQSFRQALEWSVHIYHALGKVLNDRGYESTLIGDEGGYGPRLNANREAVGLLLDAIGAAGLRAGRDVSIALDVASSEFWTEGNYRTIAGGERSLLASELVEEYAAWAADYPIVSIEDGCAEDDWEGWDLLTRRLGQKLQLVGDDLFVTNSARLAEGIRRGVANAILVKLNQIGTLSETLEVIAQAKRAGYHAIVSARSGETEDTTIAHLAVATSAGQIKIGSVARGERLAKYNELLRIEDALAGQAPFTVWAAR